MFFKKTFYVFRKNFRVRENFSKLYFLILNFSNIEFPKSGPKTIKSLILVRYMIDIKFSINHQLPFYVVLFWVSYATIQLGFLLPKCGISLILFTLTEYNYVHCDARSMVPFNIHFHLNYPLRKR